MRQDQRFMFNAAALLVQRQRSGFLIGVQRDVFRTIRTWFISIRMRERVIFSLTAQSKV
jgi:hypothetical protein